MAEANFKFVSEAAGGDQITVVSFTGSEAISSLYRYELEIKAPLAADIDLDEVLDSPASFITELDGREFPVYGVISSLDESQTVQGYVHYRVTLVPKLWRLSIYKTNEIYTHENTVDKIIETVLEGAGLNSGIDYDLSGLNDSHFLQRDYVCQFGESDFDFISRLMENEGIFFYFEQAGDVEKIIFVNDLNYLEINRPGLLYDVAAQASRQHDCINAWSCRKQRLAASVTVRDFNPDQPSLDISDTMPIDTMGQGTDYIYGENVFDRDEATYLTEIRAEEKLCQKTRYYGESSVTRLSAGYIFSVDNHPNAKYNGVEYLVIEVSHEGHHLDMNISNDRSTGSDKRPQYQNSFVAMDANEQYRPPRNTAKPRFYGTMTAFIYAEAATMNAEIDEMGRYRVQLPFDRADGTLSSTDPDRKASAWMRMAQPYVGQEQGMYYPLSGGTEVLLTFINGDPDQPIISGAVPNASQPSLLTSGTNFQRTVTVQPSQTVTGNTHKISLNSAKIAAMDEPPPAPHPSGLDFHAQEFTSVSAWATSTVVTMDGDTEVETIVAIPSFINENETEAGVLSSAPSNSMIPPWDGILSTATDATPAAYMASLINFKSYDPDFNSRVVVADGDVTDPTTEIQTSDFLLEANTDKGGGDGYVYANGRTFAYPQHERVYFIGTFHEDFHVKDGFIDPNESWTGTREQYNFPAPGAEYPSDTDPGTDSDAVVNPDGIRGVSEDKRWGNQMTYAFGRQFNWSGGQGEGDSFECVNYGNGTTEDLIRSSGGRFSDVVALGNSPHWDTYTKTAAFPSPDRPEGTVPNPYTPRDYNTKFVDGGDALAAYTFVDGNTYSYQSGDDLDVNDGNSDSWTYGTSRDYCFGHSCSWVNGDSRSDVLGSSTDMLAGNANSLTVGQTNDVFVGITTSTFVGGKIDIEVSATQGLNAAKDFRADLFEDKVTAKSNKAAMDVMEAALNKKITSLKSGCMTMNYEVLAVAQITLKSPLIDIVGASILLQGALMKIG